MTERIRELVNQAILAVDNPHPGNPLNDELADMYIPVCFSEKFVELIVQDCINITGKMPGLYFPGDHDRVSKHLKSHFGIK